MTTSARVIANRRNAKRSTGPRSLAGKQHVAKNALRHGLAIPVAALPEYDERVTRLTRLLTGGEAGQHRLELARRVAEAQVDLLRIRTAKQSILQAEINDPNLMNAEVQRSLRKYQPMKNQTDGVEGIIRDLPRELACLERYERRVISRRKFAGRAFALDEQAHQ